MPEADRDRVWLAAARIKAGLGKVRSRLSGSPDPGPLFQVLDIQYRGGYLFWFSGWPRPARRGGGTRDSRAKPPEVQGCQAARAMKANPLLRSRQLRPVRCPLAGQG